MIESLSTVANKFYGWIQEDEATYPDPEETIAYYNQFITSTDQDVTD
jgi:hypothetical protein